MKKLIIASLFLAGVSFAGNAQSAAIATANHATSPAIGKHPVKATGKTNTIAAKSMTSPAAGKTAATAGKNNVTKKATAKTNNAAGKTVASHKKHKAHKRLPKKNKQKKN